MIVGLVGSIDNDMVGTDMTIGADTALHRIVEAIDAITSTAASHQRTFVVEVMGRHCGYLALMSAIAGGADYVLIPENPPADGWEERDVRAAAQRPGRRPPRQHRGRRRGRHATATGQPISGDYVRQVLEERLGEDTRVTILGHVQRGGTPSAFDRWMSTLVGHAAVEEVLAATPDSEPQLIGMRYNRIQRAPLMECVEQTRAVARHDRRKGLRRSHGRCAAAASPTCSRSSRAMAEALPSVAPPARRAGSPVHARRRAGAGHEHRRARRRAPRSGPRPHHAGRARQFPGPDRRPDRGTELGRCRGLGRAGRRGTGHQPASPHGRAALRRRARAGERTASTACWSSAAGWPTRRPTDCTASATAIPAFKIPIICLPATIDNNLPGSELSIGADTALNIIVEALDRIKQSAMAARRCFVVEVMGRYCGYLALMSGLASGAERVYLPEEGITLEDLQADVERMVESFRGGRRLLPDDPQRTRQPALHHRFPVRRLFEEEGGDLFDVRQAVLGHIQQGGNPSPFDRIQATRLAAHCIDFLTGELERGTAAGAFIGLVEGKVTIFPLKQMPDMVDWTFRRPLEQWWLDLRPVVRAVARQPAPEK